MESDRISFEWAYALVHGQIFTIALPAVVGLSTFMNVSYSGQEAVHISMAFQRYHA